jgi:zinc-binding alcohol dehydrogenase family protein
MGDSMRAIGYKHSRPIDQADSLIDLEIEKPTPQGRDLLVEVKAVSVNPVDTKVRKRADPKGGAPKILGYDAAGVVTAVGSGAKLFKSGDEVFYAGSILRQGTDAEYHLVDERIVGAKPKTLDFAAAAALPLTSITAWEMLFDRLAVPRGGAEGRSLLIVGGAGGVGSIAIQLARHLTKLTIITSASRPETVAWCKELGAHHVIDHSKPMAAQLEAIGHRFVDYVFGVNASDQHYDTIVEIIAPQGKLGMIDDPGMFDANKLKAKSASLHWESMFTRSSFQTADMEAQHRLLSEVAKLVDTGVIRTTLAQTLGTINAANLKRAHALIESGRARGKLVLAGF